MTQDKIRNIAITAHEAYETLAENAGTHRCMLLRIAEEECEHAQMILCILQTCL